MTDLKKLADGCRIKADLYANENPTIPASFIYVAVEIERFLGVAQTSPDWHNAKVSINVSTCDDDAGDRVFGRVVDWQPEDYKDDKPLGLRLLCEYESDNFGMRSERASQGIRSLGVAQGAAKPYFLETHPDFQDPEFRRAYFADQFRSSIAIALRRFREERGLSQANLAKLCGWPQSLIARAEDWDGGMTIDTMIRAFDGLGLVPRLSFHPYAMDAAFQTSACSLSSPDQPLPTSPRPEDPAASTESGK